MWRYWQRPDTESKNGNLMESHPLPMREGSCPMQTQSTGYEAMSNETSNETSYETNIIGMFNLLDFAFICTRRSGFSRKDSSLKSRLLRPICSSNAGVWGRELLIERLSLYSKAFQPTLPKALCETVWRIAKCWTISARQSQSQTAQRAPLYLQRMDQ